MCWVSVPSIGVDRHVQHATPALHKLSIPERIGRQDSGASKPDLLMVLLRLLFLPGSAGNRVDGFQKQRAELQILLMLEYNNSSATCFLSDWSMPLRSALGPLTSSLAVWQEMHCTSAKAEPCNLPDSDTLFHSIHSLCSLPALQQGDLQSMRDRYGGSACCKGNHIWPLMPTTAAGM